MAKAPASRRRSAHPVPAYVLHHHDWSETSLILDLFTREHGRIAVVAKGAKRPYSQLRPVLLPFQRISVAVGRVDGADESADIHNLRTAEWAGGTPMRGGDTLFAGFYLNELLLKLLARGDPHPLLFDAYAATLVHLGAPDEATLQDALRAFEVVLLREIGLLPELGAVTSTVLPLVPGCCYALRAPAGLVAADEAEGGIDGRLWMVMQRALDDNRLDLLRVSCAQARSPLKLQLRSLLHYHLGGPLLRTRRIARELQRLTDAPEPLHPLNERNPP